MSSVGKPIQIVQISEDHEYILNTAALEGVLLHKNIRDKPVVVISVAGAFRQGKSLLLNFFLHTMNVKGDLSFLRDREGSLLNGGQGFNWKGGVNRVTCGIFLWSEAFLAKTPSGEEVAVIFMDTQGVFDSKSTTQDNVFIFALGTMISSVQIFNIFNNIDENHLKHLQLFTEYSRLVVEKSGNKNAAPLQKMLFLIRDWINFEDFAYGYEGGQQYLDSWLQVTGNEHQELRAVRTRVRSSFTDLNCFLMPHPGKKVASNRTSHLNLSDVDEDFMNELHDFIAKLLLPENLIPTEIGGQVLKAADLPQYFKMFVRMFNNKEVPGASNIYEATADVHNRALADQCIRQFKSDPITGQSVEEIVEGNTAKEKKALESYEGKCMESENTNQIRVNLAANLQAEVTRAIEDFEIKAETHNKNLADGFMEEYKSNPPSGKSVDEVTKGHVQRKTDILAQFEKLSWRNSTVKNTASKLLQDLDKVKLVALKEYERAADLHNKSLADVCMRKYRKSVSNAGKTVKTILQCHKEQYGKTMEHFKENCMRNSTIQSVMTKLEDGMEAEEKNALKEFQATSDEHNKNVAENCFRKFKLHISGGAGGNKSKMEEMLQAYDRERIANGSESQIRERLSDDLEERYRSEVKNFEASANTDNRNLVDECTNKYRNQSQSIEEILEYFDRSRTEGGDYKKYRRMLKDELEGVKRRSDEKFKADAEIHNSDLLVKCMKMYKDERSNIPLLKGFIDLVKHRDLNSRVREYYSKNCKNVEDDKQWEKLLEFLGDEERDTKISYWDVPLLGIHRLFINK